MNYSSSEIQRIPAATGYRARQHTVNAVYSVLQHHQPAARRGKQTKLPAQNDAFDSFVGYLMLDALIGNTDRHHENWGVEIVPAQSRRLLRLAPSYDHASSLGRELSDVKRKGRMDSSGRGTVADVDALQCTCAGR